MSYNFCTLFDKNYLSRGLALLDSLQKHLPDFTLHVLCLDADTHHFFSNNSYEQVIPIALADLEADNEQLKEARQNRSIVEYYFTLSPCLPLYILKKNPHISAICSLDSDIYFFSSPAPVFKLLEQKSIIITPHKYSAKLKNSGKEKYGLYNVSFQIFKNNPTGLACLQDWESKCIAWCYDHYDEENKRFADQKYLDEWPAVYPNEVHVLNDAVSGLAVWNVDNYNFKVENNHILVNGEPMIFYHFHHFKIISPQVALNGYAEYGVENNSSGLKHTYLVYWNALQHFNKQIKSSSESSTRIDMKKSLIKLVLIHGTVFFKIFGSLIQINAALLQKLYRVIKRT